MGQCSGSCGGGIRQRIVVCTGVLCSKEDKPIEQDSCNQEPCPAWSVGEWGKVQKTKKLCCLAPDALSVEAGMKCSTQLSVSGN